MWGRLEFTAPKINVQTQVRVSQVNRISGAIRSNWSWNLYPWDVYISNHIFILCSTAAALRCNCSDCSNGLSECTGDHCFAQIVDNGETSLRRWRCYNNVNSFLCNTTSYLHTTLCCNSADFCNAILIPTLMPPTATTSSSTSSGVATTQPATQSTLAPVINPLTETDSSDPEPTSSPLNSSSEYVEYSSCYRYFVLFFGLPLNEQCLTPVPCTPLGAARGILRMRTPSVNS